MPCLIVAFSLFLSDKCPLCLAYTPHATRLTKNQGDPLKTPDLVRWQYLKDWKLSIVNCRGPPPHHLHIHPSFRSTKDGVWKSFPYSRLPASTCGTNK